jgi:hypothetical protein
MLAGWVMLQRQERHALRWFAPLLPLASWRLAPRHHLPLRL